MYGVTKLQQCINPQAKIAYDRYCDENICVRHAGETFLHLMVAEKPLQ